MDKTSYDEIRSYKRIRFAEKQKQELSIIKSPCPKEGILLWAGRLFSFYTLAKLANELLSIGSLPLIGFTAMDVGRLVGNHQLEVAWQEDGDAKSILLILNHHLMGIEIVDHPRHRSIFNFAMNVLSAIAAYCFFDKKPSINIDYCIENFDGQHSLFQ